MKVLLHFGPEIKEAMINGHTTPPEIKIDNFRFVFGGRADGMPIYRLAI